jgi:hypothetical protein
MEWISNLETQKIFLNVSKIYQIFFSPTSFIKAWTNCQKKNVIFNFFNNIHWKYFKTIVVMPMIFMCGMTKRQFGTTRQLIYQLWFSNPAKCHSIFCIYCNFLKVWQIKLWLGGFHILFQILICSMSSRYYKTNHIFRIYHVEIWFDLNKVLSFLFYCPKLMDVHV